jgi:GntR family transcriptional regulator
VLDERSPVPLYYQLQEIIRSRIDSGQWGPGQQLPPEADLCKEFNLSRGTVRQALADLVREGMLHRRRGKGSFVAAEKIQQDIQSLTGFSEYAKNVLGANLGSRLISVKVIPATRSMAKALEISDGSDVVEIRKVKLVDDQPFFLTAAFLPRDATPGLEHDDLSDESLIQLLRDRYGFSVAKVKGWFEPVLVTEYEAPLLDVEKGSPALLYQRIRFSADDKPLMLNKNIIRGDMCRITFQVPDADED